MTPLALGPSAGPLGVFLKAPWGTLGALSGLPRGFRRDSGGPQEGSKRTRSEPQESSKANRVTTLAFGPSWGPLGALLGAPLGPLGAVLGLLWGFRRDSGGPREGSKRAPRRRPLGGPRASGTKPIALGVPWNPLGLLQGAPKGPQEDPKRAPTVVSKRGLWMPLSGGPRAAPSTPLGYPGGPWKAPKGVQERPKRAPREPHDSGIQEVPQDASRGSLSEPS